MRKFLLAATLLAPFIVGQAFATERPEGLKAAGALNLGMTSAGSTATVGSVQGTTAGAGAARTGAVVVGTVSGNHTAVETSALGKTSPKGGSYTQTTAQQTNIGGTVSGGLAVNKPGTTGVSGVTDGGQSSVAGGGAAANAKTINLGGFVNVQTPRGNSRR